MAVDPSTTKYIIRATISADGVIEKPDVIGAIFGQTEGLLGNEMDLRDLQKGARIGRIEVDLETKGGKSSGTVTLPSAMDKVESAIMAAALETIDRIGPAKATVRVDRIDDARGSKREQVVNRAKELLATINEDPGQDSGKISDEVRNAVQVAEIQKFRDTKLWCGPNVETGDSVIIVEGRSDVLNLLKYGIRNALAIEGTNVPDVVKDLTRERTTTIFVDGDRGGELIARELLETCEVDFVARAPRTREVEELPHKLVMKCLQNKLTADQYINQTGLKIDRKRGSKPAPAGEPAPREEAPSAPAREPETAGRDDERDGGRRGRGRRGGRGRGRKGDEGAEQPADDAGEAPVAAVERKAPARKGDDPRAGLRDTLSGLAGSLKATLLDDTGSAIQDGLAVRELADTLKGSKSKVHTVVFDGVITQRLLDIAADKKVQTVVGVKMGNVTKVPDTVEILTKDDLN